MNEIDIRPSVNILMPSIPESISAVYKGYWNTSFHVASTLTLIGMRRRQIRIGSVCTPQNPRPNCLGWGIIKSDYGRARRLEG